jgi:hypothetical protein
MTMVRLLIGPDDLDDGDEEPACSLQEEEGFLEIISDNDGFSIFPWFLVELDLLPEAFLMSMGSVVPYFFESILQEAGVDYHHADIEGPPWEEERDYSSAVEFYLRQKDLEGMFRKFRGTGAFGIYDLFFELEAGRIIYDHEERLVFEGFDREELEDAVEAFHDMQS